MIQWQFIPVKPPDRLGFGLVELKVPGPWVQNDIPKRYIGVSPVFPTVSVEVMNSGYPERNRGSIPNSSWASQLQRIDDKVHLGIKFGHGPPRLGPTPVSFSPDVE